MAHYNLSNDGFLHVRNAFTSSETSKLLSKVNELLIRYQNTDNILYENNIPKKLLYTFEKDELFLKMLVSEPLLKLLIENSDDSKTIVPTWEDLIIKQPFSENGINPHQDLPMQSLIGNTFTIAVYLHDSDHNPVYFLPGSHKLGALTRNQITELYKNNKNKFVPIIAAAGDVVLHYAKVVHYSLPNTTAMPRYTWYVEFRTLNQLYQDSPWDEKWILRRRAIFVYALKKYQPDYLSELVPDIERLKPYLNTIQLKVPHVTDTINFDMNSPYYHF